MKSPHWLSPSGKMAGLALLLAALSVLLAFRFPDGKNLNRIAADAEGYYNYLPALFIYGNLTDIRYKPLQYSHYPGTDKVDLKVTCGVAWMEAPFFGVAHLLAKFRLFGARDTSGYGGTYSDAVVVSSIFYVMLGLWLLGRLLVRTLPAWQSALILLALYFGSNLFFYTAGQSGMSHPYSFFLACCLLALTPSFYAQPSPWRFALMGFVIGLALVMRPTNALMGLYPLLYGLSSRADILARLQFYRQHLLWLGLAIAVAAIPWIPQLLYWKYLTGSYWYYSYQHETFSNWASPHLFDIFLNVQNGLLIYSPVLVLAFAGLFWLAWANREQGRVLLLILALASYAFASWWAWWFGAAFGHRAFVEFLPFLALPMGVVVNRMMGAVPWRQWATSLLLLACMYYTTGLSYLYRAPWDGPAWNWEKFGDIVLQLVHR